MCLLIARTLCAATLVEFQWLIGSSRIIGCLGVVLEFGIGLLSESKAELPFILN